ncbi:MAG TPA: STAS domain-containing protein [Acidobacteriaceae bacterium]|jgi:anti-anti-sigma factor|nr:STAS domain-containing protein [Acidobacteriaceae bacterium]
MKFSSEEIDGGITRVVLDGRLDIEGASLVDLKMNIVAGTAKSLLIDLAAVTFLGSMGLRSIVVPAKNVHRRGGKAALLAPQPMVEEVIKSSSIDQIIPIYHDLDAAVQALR